MITNVNKTVFLSLLSIFSICILACQSGKMQALSLTGNPVVTIHPENKKQKIKSIGGNYCQANYTSEAWDLVGRNTINRFRPTHVRVGLPLQFKGVSYEEYKGNQILQQHAVKSLLQAMKEMKENYGVVNFTVSVWRVADELVENPDSTNKRRIKPDKYSEVIDMIEAFLLAAKNDYGVEADFFSFNESNGGYMTLFTPAEGIVFMNMAGNRFASSGLKTIFLWGDTSSTKTTVAFASAIASDTSVVKYLGPLSFHSWWSEDMPDSVFDKVAALAAQYNRPVWCTELGHDALAHRTPGYNLNWDYAFRFARISHRVFNYSNTEVSMFWTWQKNYEIMSADTLTKYPVYYITRHQTDYLNGVQLIEAQSSDTDILPLCGYNKDNRMVLQLVNLKTTSVTLNLENMPGADAEWTSSTETELWKKETTVLNSAGNAKVIVLQPRSVNTLVF